MSLSTVSRAALRQASSHGRRNFSSTSVAQAAEVKKLGVIGAGQMGLGIALVAAMKAKVHVTLVDSAQPSIDKGLKFADKGGDG